MTEAGENGRLIEGSSPSFFLYMGKKNALRRASQLFRFLLPKGFQVLWFLALLPESGFLNGRRRTGLEVLLLLLFDLVGVIVFGLTAGDFGVGVYVNRDQFIQIHYGTLEVDLPQCATGRAVSLFWPHF